jgi:VanZ family protein
MRRILGYWAPVIAWVALIFFFSTDVFEPGEGGLTHRFIRAILLAFSPDLSPQTIETVHILIRKLAHVVEYGVLVLLLYRAVRQDSLEPRHWRWALPSLLLALLIAGLDEFHQSYTSMRTGSIRDLGLDSAGMLIAQLMIWWRHYRR